LRDGWGAQPGTQVFRRRGHSIFSKGRRSTRVVYGMSASRADLGDWGATKTRTPGPWHGDPHPPVHSERCRLGQPHLSPDVSPPWSTRPQLLLEAGSGRVPGPGPAFAADRYPAVPLGSAAEDRAVLGLLLDLAGPGGRVGGVEVLGRVNPRPLWKLRGALPTVAMIAAHFLGCYIRWAGRPRPWTVGAWAFLPA